MDIVEGSALPADPEIWKILKNMINPVYYEDYTPVFMCLFLCIYIFIYLYLFIYLLIDFLYILFIQINSPNKSLTVGVLLELRCSSDLETFGPTEALLNHL